MFKFTYAPGTTLQQMLGFEIAGRVWDAYLNDSVTINLHVGVVSSSSLPSKVIGGALPGIRANEFYSTVRDRLYFDRKSTDDSTAYNSLDLTDEAWFDKWEGGVNKGSTECGSSVNLTRANAKALGYTFSDSSGLDGYIVFSNLAGSSYSWNYDYTRSSTASATSVDFLSTVIHEIGHTLGFVSGIDRPGWLYNSYTNWSLSQSWDYDVNLDTRIKMTMPLDLFRYSQTSWSSSWLDPRRDMAYGSWGGDKYFSIDKGKTAISSFSTGADTTLGGDGQQASHWKSGGIMAPTLRLGARPWLTNVDLRALDVIGWDVNLNPTISLSTLQSQAISALATRAGQTTTWVTNNLATSPSSLVVDLSSSVATMLQNSVIYNWGNQTGDGAWQTIFSLMSQQGVFSSVDELESGVTVRREEFAGQVLTQADLQALLDRPGQQPTVLPRSTVSTTVEPSPSLEAIDVSFSVASSTPSLTLPSQGLDAAKVWTIGEKQRLNPILKFEPEPTKKPISWSSEIDA